MWDSQPGIALRFGLRVPAGVREDGGLSLAARSQRAGEVCVAAAILAIIASRIWRVEMIGVAGIRS